jgi:hypothetical protein
LDLQRGWFAALRAACAEMDPRRDLLLAAPATATGRFVERCAALFNLRWLRVEAAEGGAASLGKWGRRICAEPAADQPATMERVVLSPPLGPTGGAASDGDWMRAPCRDRAVAALSDQLVVLRLRPGGQWDRLVRARLIDPSWPLASVRIAVGPGLTPPELAQGLLDLGAVGWSVPQADEQRRADAQAALPEGPERLPAAMTAVPPAEGWEFLTHCTRRRDGPWPGQSEQEYLDDLILGRPGADHSALAALRRIAQQQRLIASSEGIRGAARAVSFTDVPLAELRRLHVFRPHRGRWDFEPFGICIRRHWLEQLGARPVLYGDDRLWAALPPEQRPFFQMRQARAAGHSSMDWTVEREWRCLEDVDLRRLPSSEAFLFAPSDADARDLARVSRWPVAVVHWPTRSERRAPD